MTGSGAAPAAVARFAPRRIPLAQGAGLVRETWALVARAPLRLLALALFITVMRLLPQAATHGFFAMLLGAALGTVLDAGFFRALESVRAGRNPGFGDIGSVFLLPVPKYLLLLGSGAVTFLIVLALWWIDWGPQAMGDWAAQVPAEGLAPQPMPERERWIELATDLLTGMPLFFLEPLVVLFPWSASRTFSGTLIAALANAPWVLVVTLIVGALDLGLGGVLASLDAATQVAGAGAAAGGADATASGAAGAAVGLAGLVRGTAFEVLMVAIDAFGNAFVYVLLLRSLR